MIGIKVTLYRYVLVLLFTAAFPSASQAYDAASMVVSAKGSLPLLMTAPHDGGDLLGFLSVRTKGPTLRDSGTRELTERVAAIFQERLGNRPYIVIAKFSRKYLDANRAEEDAMESAEALPAYRAYHEQIASFVVKIRNQFPGGSLLLDVHGQSDEPDTTFRGTRAGLTTTSLLKRHGPAALQGGMSIIGLLAAKGYRVNPSVDAPSLNEDRRFSGGYTVSTYGSHRADGIDAIQLEFGKNHRANPRLAEDLAEALIIFMRTYELLPR